MKNQVGREIPDEILARMGKTGYRGLHDRDNASYRKASPTVRALNDPQRSKLCASLREALEKCELHDGMYFGFHHHFRDGDYVINMVMQEVARMGIRDITICATSMGAAHDALEPLIKQGVIAGIQSSGVRGKIGEAISRGKFKKPAIIRSHGGRVRAIEEGDIHLTWRSSARRRRMNTETRGRSAARAIAACCPIRWRTPNTRIGSW